MAIDQVRPSEPEAQRMTRSRNVMMFKRPDFGVAMANAGDQLKRRASKVNDCCNVGGFGEAVDRCLLDSGIRSR
jgi:hypothetical protein